MVRFLDRIYRINRIYFHHEAAVLDFKDFFRIFFESIAFDSSSWYLG